MSNSTPNKSSIKTRYAVIFLLIAGLVFGFLYAAGLFGGHGTTAQKFVNLQENNKPQFSFRRAHAKGVCLAGEFVSSGLLAPYSTSEFFQEGAQPFVGRFSIAGGNPLAPDLAAPVRSLALSFASDSGQRWRTAMNTPPVMAVRTPEDFYQQIQVLTPDPTTGKPNGEKIKAFFAAHPETAAFNQWKQGYTPTTSFATEQYHSINAFYLLDAKGQRQAVRWSAVPQASAQAMADDISASERDALQLELAQRLENDPVRFDLMVSFADASDDENNATIAWPAERKTINAGTLVISAVHAQNGGACDGINFDPLVLPRGMQATADPILNARGSAYAESYRRRAREILLESQGVGAQQ
ncbi:catalase family peroxidase [Denitrificimonas caeni]|uniref:catalase family peroxidase n=1 Tax=Denitrificimonas caeni TaxID=521720 RepID=UPI001965F841|nr:catalase family peroxidase [Denitrificimonas caeni]